MSLLLLLCALSVLAHELGHASALSRYGGTPSGIGFGLFILLPVFYADVSQAWRLRRWQRIVVDIGGIYFQQLFFAFAALLATLWNSPSLRAVCVAIDLMTVIALNPAFRFDGYWVVADWLGLTRLHRSAGLYLRSMVHSIFRRRSAQSECPPHLSRRENPGLHLLCAAEQYISHFGHRTQSPLGLLNRVGIGQGITAARPRLAQGFRARKLDRQCRPRGCLRLSARVGRYRNRRRRLAGKDRGAFRAAKVHRCREHHFTGFRRTIMKLTLMHPPLDDPTVPYHSTAYLKGHLAANGFHDVSMRDINIEYVNWLLRPDTVAKINDEASSLLASSRGAGTLGHETQEKYYGILAAGRSDPAEIERAASGMRSKDAFLDFPLYVKNLNTLTNYTHLLGALSYPAEHDGFMQMSRGRFSAAKMADLLDAELGGKVCLPFTRFFQHALVNDRALADSDLLGISIVYDHQLFHAFHFARMLRSQWPDKRVVLEAPPSASFTNI